MRGRNCGSTEPSYPFMLAVAFARCLESDGREQEALRTLIDTRVARYGGDEFVVLLRGAPTAAAQAALQRAVNAVAALPQHLAHGVTLSGGTVTIAAHEPTANSVARADATMYQAKRRGGNQVAGGETVTREARRTAGGTMERAPGGGAWALPDAP